MRIGFIGTGALASAIVTGLKSGPSEAGAIVVSPRNAEIASGLAARFADVIVAADNQSVLDACDMVMLAVRPQDMQSVLSALIFRDDHHVVSLIATKSLSEVQALVAPAGRTTLALPMPMVAHRKGPTIIYPPDTRVAGLFSQLGKAIEVSDASEFDTLGVVTATFATYFRYLGTIDTWLGERGIRKDAARDYVSSTYEALTLAATLAPDMDYSDLSQDYATRGGLNEQVVEELAAAGVYDALRLALDNIHRRITASKAI